MSFYSAPEFFESLIAHESLLNHDVPVKTAEREESLPGSGMSQGADL